MKLKQKIISVLSAAVCALSFCAETVTVRGADYSNNIKYEDYLYYKKVDEDEDGIYDYAEISGCSTWEANVVIPSEIDGLPVMSIGDFAFYNCSSLTSIAIPNGVTSIGKAAFSRCSGLTGVDIPNSVTSIGDFAFYYCSALTNIEIPDSVRSIGWSAFYNCSGLTRIEIPNGVTSIEDETFYECTSLTSIEIPDSVTSIGNCAFSGCTGISNIKIPDSVTSIDGNAFAGTALGNQTGIKYADKWVIGCDNDVKSAVIKNGTKGIVPYAFSGCISLESVKIPDSVKYILGMGLFLSDGLTSISVSKGNENYCSIDGILFNKDKTELIKYPARKTGTKYSIPDSVTSIRECAFSDCKYLTSIKIPDSVRSIGDYTFGYCTSLTSIEIPDSVTSISYGAFDNCKNLTIYGNEDSYAQTYAEENDISFKPLSEKIDDYILGDANEDGAFNIRDAAWICIRRSKGIILNIEKNPSADFNEDGFVNVRDAAAIAIYFAKKAIQE